MYCVQCKKIIADECYRCSLVGNYSNIRICDACYQSYREILGDPYEYTFKGKGKIHYGIELEFECEEGREIEVISKIDFSKNDRFIKHDSSLHYGIELVSQPCTLLYHKNKFGWGTLCKTLKKLNCYTRNGTGLHIHFSNKFSDTHQYKMFLFANRHWRNLLKISIRAPNDWCWSYADISKGSYIYYRNEKYSILNFNNTTIEFRLPQATFNYKRIFANLEFLDGMITYTRKKNILYLKTISWDDFMIFMSHNNYMYFLNFYKYTHKFNCLEQDSCKKKKGISNAMSIL